MYPDKWKRPDVDIIFTDGHASRYDWDLISELEKDGILLFRFPSHLTHLYQPLDLVFFSVLKKGFQEETSKWLYDHQNCSVTMNHIPEIVREAYYRASSIATVVSSWKRSNIYPFNPEGIVQVMKEKVEVQTATQNPMSMQEHVEHLISLVAPTVEPEKKASTHRVTLRQNGKAMMLSGPEASKHEAEDQLWRLLRDGKVSELQSLCDKYKVPDFGTKKAIRKRIIPELRTLGLLSLSTDDQVNALMNK